MLLRRVTRLKTHNKEPDTGPQPQADAQGGERKPCETVNAENRDLELVATLC
jgi:hypothetical protein